MNLIFTWGRSPCLSCSARLLSLICWLKHLVWCLVNTHRQLIQRPIPASNDLHTNALSSAWDKWNINALPSAWYLSGLTKKNKKNKKKIKKNIKKKQQQQQQQQQYVLCISCMYLYLTCIHVCILCETWITCKILTYHTCSRRCDLRYTILHPIVCVRGAVMSYSNLHNHSCSSISICLYISYTYI